MNGWRAELLAGFSELLLLLSDEETLSAYELHSSGVVQALVNCLNVSRIVLFQIKYILK